MKRQLLPKLAAILEKTAISYEDYKKKHPKTRKNKNDPMFGEGGGAAPAAGPDKGDGAKKPVKTTPADHKYEDAKKKKQEGHPDYKGKSDMELAEMSGLKMKGPGDTKWKSKEFQHLKPSHQKALTDSLKRLKDDGYEREAKKIESGEWNFQKAHDWAEHNNFKGLTSLLDLNRGSADYDHAAISHAEHRQDHEGGEAYPGERDGALATKYEAAEGGRSDHGKQWDEKYVGNNQYEGNSVRNRKLRTLGFLDHHGMQDSDTYKDVKDHIDRHKDHYKKHVSDLLGNYKKNHDEIGKDKTTKDWSPEDQKRVKDYYKGEHKHVSDLAKKHGLL